MKHVRTNIVAGSLVCLCVFLFVFVSLCLSVSVLVCVCLALPVCESVCECPCSCVCLCALMRACDVLPVSLPAWAAAPNLWLRQYSWMSSSLCVIDATVCCYIWLVASVFSCFPCSHVHLYIITHVYLSENDCMPVSLCICASACSKIRAFAFGHPLTTDLDSIEDANISFPLTTASQMDFSGLREGQRG